MKNSFVIIFLFLFTSSHSQDVKVTMFRDSALDCYWNPANRNLIAYSFKGKDHYYDIYIASPNGKRFVGGIQRSLITQEGYIVIGKMPD